MAKLRLGALLVAALVAASLVTVSGARPAASRWVVTDIMRLAALAYPAYQFHSFVGTTPDGRIYWLAYGNRDGRSISELFEWQNGTISDLGAVPMVFAVVNARGAVSGTDYSPLVGTGMGPPPQPPAHTYLWQNGVATRLGTFGPFAYVDGLNDRGQVAEEYYPAGGPYLTRSAIWQDGTTTDLGTLGGKWTEAVALNDRAQVVGSSQPASGYGHAFLWEKGKMTDLGTLRADESEAVGVNQRGQIVGLWRRHDSRQTRAFLWQKGKAVDLGPVSDGLPLAINDHGWVIRSTVGEIADHGLLWHDGKTFDLGSPGGRQTYPLALNERGQVVGTTGTYYTNPPRLRAFLWEAGKLTVLPTRILYYASAMSIDATGSHIVLGTCCPGQLLLWTRR